MLPIDPGISMKSAQPWHRPISNEQRHLVRRRLTEPLSIASWSFASAFFCLRELKTGRSVCSLVAQDWFLVFHVQCIAGAYRGQSMLEIILGHWGRWVRSSPVEPHLHIVELLVDTIRGPGKSSCLEKAVGCSVFSSLSHLCKSRIVFSFLSL